MKKNFLKFLVILCIIFTIFLLRFSGIENYINLETLKENREYLLNFVCNNYWASVFTYISIYILVVTLSFFIATPLTLIGGFLFGVWPGVIYTNIGATIGAIFTFLLFRYLLGSVIQKKYYNDLIKFNKNIELYGTNYLLIARFTVFIPFFLINIFAAFTKIPLKTFIWTTSLGIIPGSIVYAYAGKEIIGISSIKDIFSVNVILAFLLLILFGFISILIKKSYKQ